MQAPLKQFIYKVQAYHIRNTQEYGWHLLNNAMLSTGNNFYQV